MKTETSMKAEKRKKHGAKPGAGEKYDHGRKPDITFFFPAYNEEKNLPKLIKDAKDILEEVAGKWEILIVLYAGSTDRSAEIVESLHKKDSRIRLVMQPKDEKGVGWGIKLGFDAARYEHIFYADSDNQFYLRELKNFLPYIHDYDVIAGYRINRQDPWLRILTSRVYNTLIRLLFRTKERDVDCAFRYVNKKLFRKVKLICRLGLATSELLVKARRSGFRIREVGVTHLPRYAGASVFEGEGLPLPRLSVVMDLFREMRVLWKDIHGRENINSSR
ncbi:glycosyltransferase [Candidatus Woesearchaeota archaeon]|nr:glycosyltransferase [Candidatus Woesearchaeota archaeon]